ncbi:MAG: peptide chain release factor N(5)-glutamine methyltransferase [Candidatus Margulisiibacteriota bacterium]
MTWTISSLLDWTTIYFANHKIEEPHLEAEILLAHALHIKRIQIYTMHDRVLSEEELAAFKQLMLRRIKMEPTAYIIGYRPFMSLDFDVNREVLIPRPETEKLVEEAINIIKGSEKETVSVLDIGTGSGAIAVSIAKYCANTRVWASDISKAAIETAKSNAKKHGVDDRITFFTGDLFSPIDKNAKFDIIVSNPPYIKTLEIENLQPEITKFEPVRALDGGPDGLAYYRKITAQAPAYLSEKGHLLLEVGAGQADDVVKMIQATGIFAKTKKIQDHNGIDRVIESVIASPDLIGATKQ